MKQKVVGSCDYTNTNFLTLKFCSDLFCIEKIFEKMKVKSLEHRGETKKLMSSLTPKPIMEAWTGKVEQAIIIFYYY